MTINRRRAPASEVSRAKKLGGHQNEDIYAALIGGVVLKGTKKSDVSDSNGEKHSVKSGKKWQVFLYSYDRIIKSEYLNILKPCVESFPEDWDKYNLDRERCIAYKELYIQTHGREKGKQLTNYELSVHLGSNLYMSSKENLAIATEGVAKKLEDKELLQNFLKEALFNNNEVSYLAIKDDSYKRDGKFKVFSRCDVLKILANNLSPSTSQAGLVPEDYNVAGQKTLLRYSRITRTGTRMQNCVEIEIRNESREKFRLVRFNMKSRDTLSILLNDSNNLESKYVKNSFHLFGEAVSKLAPIFEQ